MTIPNTILKVKHTGKSQFSKTIYIPWYRISFKLL